MGQIAKLGFVMLLIQALNPPVTFCMHVQQKRGNFGLLDRPNAKGTNETPNQMNHNANTTTDRRRGSVDSKEGIDLRVVP